MAERWTEKARTRLGEVMGRTLDEVTFLLPDGTEKKKYLLREPSAAAVLALTPDMQVIIATQYRPGPDEILYEMPGGFIEDGEDPGDTAARELLEETGYEGTVEFAGSCWDDARSNARRYAYVARDCVLVAEQNLDPMEFVTVDLVSIERFKEIARNGLMTDVELAYRALDHLGLLTADNIAPLPQGLAVPGPTS
ncbi:NUDIX hydrolase [Kitasatospora sp. LaBMicrA B282]|uniref:NUDIX hydrolase n=1 Tax=Kitasatospora sp. LaBMicrA B282 TaxID=3420949 RepID=UPI003D0FCD0A